MWSTRTLQRNGDDDAQNRLMAAYLREVGRHAVLSRAEEFELAREYVRSRSPRLEARLLTANLKLVMKIAWEYRRQRAPLLDLVQEGNVGLLEAIRRFEPERNVRLPSYAGWWIRAFILKFLMDNARLVRTVRTRVQRTQFFEGILPPADVSLEDVFETAERALADDDERMRPDLLVERDEAKRFVSNRLAAFGGGLDDREALVFTQRVLAPEPAPLRELGDQLSMTGERVRQIEKSLIARFCEFVNEAAAA